MGSSGKKRTTRAKLDREGKLRQKRVEKETRKAARKLLAAGDASQAAVRTHGHAENSTGRDDLSITGESR